MNNSFEEIRKTIELNENIVISGHTNADVDAIGASYALASSLKALGKNVTLLLEEGTTQYFWMPTKGFAVSALEKDFIPDLFIAVDCGDKERLGQYQEIFDRSGRSINIDHHITNPFFAKQNYVDKEASSTSEIVFRLLYGYGPIDDNIAAALYSGIIFDTGGFRHKSTTSVTLSIAAALMEYDFDFTSIYNKIFHSRSLAEAQIMGVALHSIEQHAQGGLLSAYVSKADMERYHGDSDSVSEISSYLKGITGAKAIVFFYEKGDNVYKASMRSEDPVDVAKVAALFGGGGHRLAAGCTIQGDLKEIRSNIIKEIEQQLS